jgi:hypothetical protein
VAMVAVAMVAVAMVAVAMVAVAMVAVAMVAVAKFCFQPLYLVAMCIDGIMGNFAVFRPENDPCPLSLDMIWILVSPRLGSR